MRRERRRFNKDQMDIKQVLYILGGILSLAVIAFIAIFLLYGTGNTEETDLARFNALVMDDYNTNDVEEASSQMGRTVNEVESSSGTNEIDNTVSNETSNEVSSEIVSSDENEDTTKYAVNTSKTEGKTVEEAKKEDDNVKEEEKEETVKDPEFAMPVEGEILREYAKESLVYSPTLDEWITHNGIDIVAEKTTVVKASAEGTVKSIKNDPRYGLTVVIEHANGFSSVYSNLLTAEFIEEGENVEQGQTIGTVGNTATFEIADESHLHFEILKDDVSVDPELYIK